MGKHRVVKAQEEANWAFKSSSWIVMFSLLTTEHAPSPFRKEHGEDKQFSRRSLFASISLIYRKVRSRY